MRHLRPKKYGHHHARTLVVLSALAVLGAAPGYAQTSPPKDPATEWRNYAGDQGSTKYSALTQIDSTNFKRLHIAWTWRSVEEQITAAHPELKSWAWECTPLMVDGVLYLSTSMSQAVALDAETGKLLWTYDPETWKNGTPSNNGFVERGVTYWESGDDKRILFGTGDGYLIALNAKTGQPIPTFGTQGRIDLTQGLGRSVTRKLYGVSSPPVVCRDVLIVGSKVNDIAVERVMPPGSVRGFDVRTGKELWTFHTIPQAGEYGNKTWEKDSWKTTGSANAWAPISLDEELGYVYLPIGTPSNDNYGGKRLGNGLFGESVLALDARTGKRAWDYQIVHHGLWDYDPPAAPTLLDVTVNDKPVKALAQVTKQGFVYVLDRRTGKPIWDIVERPVPQSTVPGERSSATQPFPTRPAPIDRQGVTEDDLVDFTPALRDSARARLARFNYGPLYTPPMLNKPTILMPGTAGGASWAGAAFDPETGILYVPSNTLAQQVNLKPSPVAGEGYQGGASAMPTLADGIPLWKPPYGRLTAIDMSTGDRRWMAPMGDLAQQIPALKKLKLPPLGRPARTHVLLTKTLLITAQEGTTQREAALQNKAAGAHNSDTAGTQFQVVEPTLVAYDKATGRRIGEINLPRNATAAPMTYMLNGQQYVAVATGGANLPAELIVLRLN